MLCYAMLMLCSSESSGCQDLELFHENELDRCPTLTNMRYMSRPIEGKYSQSRHPGMQRLESSRVRDDQRLPRATQRPSRYIPRGKGLGLDFAREACIHTKGYGCQREA